MKFFVILLAISISSAVYSDELHSVLVVYRHGDRTPTEFAPNDPLKDPQYWPVEPGELTNRGKQQQYALGRWLRDRYSKFLPQTYHKTDIYVRSTSTDRCLMSAAANLAGLYPPTSGQVWSSTIPWMPVPIHSVPVEEDNLLRMGRTCPKFNEKYGEYLKTENFTKLDEENRELYEFLSTSVGEKVDSFDDVEKYFDTLEIEAEHNMRLPEWTHKILREDRKVFPDEMKILADYSYRTPTATAELARLETGRFFETLAAQFEATARNKSENKLAEKMVMFSAHKSTIASVTNALDVFRLAPYAGTLMFELKKNEDKGKFYVNTVFKNGNSLEHLEIDGCKVDCDFDQFLAIVAPLRLAEDQWKAECFSGANPLGISSVILTMFYLLLRLIF